MHWNVTSRTAGRRTTKLGESRPGSGTDRGHGQRPQPQQIPADTTLPSGVHASTTAGCSFRQQPATEATVKISGRKSWCQKTNRCITFADHLLQSGTPMQLLLEFFILTTSRGPCKDHLQRESLTDSRDFNSPCILISVWCCSYISKSPIAVRVSFRRSSGFRFAKLPTLSCGRNCSTETKITTSPR